MRLLFFSALHFIVAGLLAWWSTPLTALAAGGVGMLEAIREKRLLSGRVASVFGIAYLFFACFFVWHEEYDRASLLEQKSGSLRPYLTEAEAFVRNVTDDRTGKPTGVHLVMIHLANIHEHPASELRCHFVLLDHNLKDEPLQNV